MLLTHSNPGNRLSLTDIVGCNSKSMTISFVSKPNSRIIFPDKKINNLGNLRELVDQGPDEDLDNTTEG